MINAAFLFVAVIALGAAMFKAASMLRPHRRPGEGLILVLLFTLAVSCFTLSDKVQYQEDRLYPDMGRLLSNVSTMAAAFTILALLITLSLPQPEARPRLRRHLLALVGSVVGMSIAFAVASPLPETLGDFGGLYAARPELLIYIVLYLAYLGTALAELLARTRRYARLTRRQPWLRAGLLLMGAGSVLGLAYVAEKAVYVFTQATRLPPPFSSDRGCRSLVSPPQCAFSITLPITAVFLAAIGATLPVWGTGLTTPFRYCRDRRSFQALGPLWQDIREAFPHVALDEPGEGPRWDLAFRLYRRVIEIQDGRLLLRPYTSEPVTTLATQVAEARGLRGKELLAVIEAAEIAAALRVRRAGSLPPAPLPERAAVDHDDVRRETAWLAEVARAYATSPVVRDIIRSQREAACPERPEPAL